MSFGKYDSKFTIKASNRQIGDFNLKKVFFVSFMVLIFPVIWLVERTSMKIGVVMGSLATLIGAILKCVVKQELWIQP